MKGLFIDSGAFIAVANPRDQYLEVARAAWRKLAADARPLFSSEHVLDEVVTTISRTQGAHRAVAWLRNQLESGLIRWLSTAPGELEAAGVWLEKYADQQVSFTDSISFVLMRREGIEDVFGFDRHFPIAGFRIWPA